MPRTVNVQLSDWMYGQPVAGAHVRLFGPASEVITEGISDAAGRCPLILSDPDGGPMYRLVADAGRYFAGLGIEPAYADVAVSFRDHASEVQLYLGPSGYVTYIGRWPVANQS